MTLSVQPVSHSTYAPEYIAQEVVSRYAFKEPPRVQLLYRGVNDVYVVRDGNEKMVLRVWRSGTRTMAVILRELAFLKFLKERGIPVSTHIPLKTGEDHFILSAPEGDRPAVLYTWAPGLKFADVPTVPMGEKIGAKFAEMHLIARDFPTEDAPDQTAQSLVANLPALLEWVEDRPDDIRDYTRLTENVIAFMPTLLARDLPRGMCHQDMHASNVHIAADGSFTFIDFDGCSDGYWLHDVKNFVFGNLFYGMPNEYGLAFERGYNTVRPYTADEKASGELILMIKAFRLLAGAARASRSRGRDLLRFKSLDWFAEFIKSRAYSAGLLGGG